jgi:hypothetical protein
MWMPRATLSRPLIAAVATFALGAPPAGAAASRDTATPATQRLEVHLLAARGHDVSVAVWTSRGSLRDVSLTLHRDGEVVAHRQLDLITPRHRTVVFAVAETGGKLAVTVTADEHHRRSTPPQRRHTTSTTSS